MFAKADREVAKHIIAAHAAECAYAAAMNYLEENKVAGIELFTNTPGLFEEYWKEVPGSETFRKKKSKITSCLVEWACRLLSNQEHASVTTCYNAILQCLIEDEIPRVFSLKGLQDYNDS